MKVDEGHFLCGPQSRALKFHVKFVNNIKVIFALPKKLFSIKTALASQAVGQAG